ncbi:MAG: hypothetical protein RIC80_02590 [Cyclobacteriaceae bacterium]
MKYLLSTILTLIVCLTLKAQVTTYPYSESFESGLGLWTQSSADNINWTRTSGSTPSGITGPSSANDGSYYMYTEASGSANPSKLATLISPDFDISMAQSVSIDFNYHMYGNDMGSLKLQVKYDNGSWVDLFNKSGEQGNTWFLEEIEICLDTAPSNTMGLRFQGVTGSDYQSDMAIDNIKIEIVELSNSTSFPEVQDFELAGSLGMDWQNSDGSGWQRTSNPSQSSTTGPDAAASGNYYIYFDAQTMGSSTQILTSQSYIFDPGDLAVFGFSYHMYGAQVQELTLNAISGCSLPQQIWTKSGDQGNQWMREVIDLTPYISSSAPSSIQLEFVANASSGDGNIALDFFEISDLGYVDSEVTNPGGGGGGGPSPWDVQTDDGVYLSSGKVAINTDTISTDHELLVNGTISAEEVRVEVYNVPDYVFEEHYELNTLSEIEKYIDLNGHLPEVLPARVLEETGINTGEFNMLLLRKIEELTLYIIEQNKRILELENRTTNR